MVAVVIKGFDNSVSHVFHRFIISMHSSFCELLFGIYCRSVFQVIVYPNPSSLASETDHKILVCGSLWLVMEHFSTVVLLGGIRNQVVY